MGLHHGVCPILPHPPRGCRHSVCPFIPPPPGDAARVFVPLYSPLPAVSHPSPSSPVVELLKPRQTDRALQSLAEGEVLPPVAESPVVGQRLVSPWP